ncbi:MAG: MBOAT family O-acyltransferase, partial [Planctomycetota bacterium JB042]
KLLLLVASYAFYAGWDWRFLSLIVASTVVDFAVGARLGRTEGTRARRALLALSLAVNLGLLGFFKYFNFFVDSGAAFLSWLGLEASPSTLSIVLPVGISFYTFQTLSYTIDVYRRNLEPVRSPLDFALFVAFVPQLVAGPIVRAAHFLPQLTSPRRFADVDVRACLTLFLFGFVKKACVADHFGMVVDRVFEDPAAFAAGAKWLALSLYTAQIYCDFSGYSDMAIATAGLLGYRLALNFDFPYLATSVTRFWRRWHISLSSWFRDYLYIPLGGNRVSTVRTGVNLVIVFFLCGLWHGASWTFVVWGLFHGGFLVVERFVARRREGGGTATGGRGAWIGLPYTLLVAMIAWVFFRSPDLPAAVAYLEGLLGRDGGPAPSEAVDGTWWWIVLVGFAFVHALLGTTRLKEGIDRLPPPLFAVLYGAAVALALPFAAAGYTPFIYFQF